MQHFIDKVWVNDTRGYARTKDGLVASYRFADWERLRDATPQQRADSISHTPAYTGLKSMKTSALRGCSPVPASVKGL